MNTLKNQLGDYIQHRTENNNAEFIEDEIYYKLDIIGTLTIKNVNYYEDYNSKKIKINIDQNN